MAEELGRIPLSAALQGSLLRARGYTQAQAHAQITLEHLLLALTEDEDAALLMQSCGLDLARLRNDVAGFLGGLSERLPPGAGEPLISPALTQILKYATLAAQQGRRSRIDGAIVLAALIGEGRSMAASFLTAQGLTFEQAIRVLQRGVGGAPPPQGAPVPPQPSPQPAPVYAAPPQADAQAPNAAPGGHLAAGPGPAQAGPQHSSPTAPPPAGSATEAILAAARERVEARGGTPPPRFDLSRLQSSAAAPEPALDLPPLAAVNGAASAAEPEPPTAEVMPALQEPTHPAPPAAPEPAPDLAAQSFQATEAAAPPPVQAFAPAVAEPPPSYEPEPQAPQPPMPPPQPSPAPQAVAPPQAVPAPSPYDGPPPPSAQAWAPPPLPVPQPAASFGGAPGPRVAPRPALPGPPPGVAPPPRPPGGHAPHVPQVQPQPSPRPVPEIAPWPEWADRHAGVGQGAGPMSPGPGPGAMPPGSGYGHQQGYPPPQHQPEWHDPPHQPGPPLGGPGTRLPARGSRPRGPAIEAGQLAHTVPNRLRIGRPVTVEVRIARPPLPGASPGGRPTMLRSETVVARAICVRLKSARGGVTIDALSPETQWDQAAGNTRLSGDMAVWRFTLLPTASGGGELVLAASARTIGADAVIIETALPDQVIPVRVRGDVGPALRQASLLALIVLGTVTLVETLRLALKVDVAKLIAGALGFGG